MSDPSAERLTRIIPAEYRGQRLDLALARLFPAYSRARLQQWIRQGEVRVDDCLRRPRDAVSGGETVVVTPRVAPSASLEAEALPLEVTYEDAHLLVVDKPPGRVVHPAAGNRQGTLLNALLHYAPELAAIPRAGIVHRLDKDTSGLMVVARTLPAHKRLVSDLRARRVEREYLALVQGRLVAGGTIEAPIGRHPVNRKRMAVVQGGREAVTHYRIERRLRAHTLLRVRLETGRTHQIRVHMAHIRAPVVGDPVYGGRPKLPAGASAGAAAALSGFRRQALHATRLALAHPETAQALQWEARLPSDMRELVEALAE